MSGVGVYLLIFLNLPPYLKTTNGTGVIKPVNPNNDPLHCNSTGLELIIKTCSYKETYAEWKIKQNAVPKKLLVNVFARIAESTYIKYVSTR
jgi:hypothetical protein